MIYLDNNATTACLPEVCDAQAPYLREVYANPSSVHLFGQRARHAVESARQQVAAFVGADANEIVFTSGGTESINLAIKGAAFASSGDRPGQASRRRSVTTAVEHSAVLRVVESLARGGWEVINVGVDGEGRIDKSAWRDAIDGRTALVSLQHANNETGVVFDVEKLAGIAKAQGALVHVDACQSAGKLPIPVGDWPVDLMSLAAHKFHGPKGVGALYVRRGTKLEPLIEGGAQELDQRGGTENVAGVVGMGAAARAAGCDLASCMSSVQTLRDEFEQAIVGQIPGSVVNGVGAERVANTSNLSFPGVEAEALLILLSQQGLCASAGAACSSGALEPSHVLRAMGLSDERAEGAVRFSLSRLTTEAEISGAIRTVVDAYGHLQNATPARS